MNNAMLLTDGYKLDHRRQYPKGTEYVYSTWIARSNKYLPEAKEVVVFGMQYFIKKYLIEYFNDNFFKRNKEEVVKEFQEFIDNYLGSNNVGTKHIEELYDLGYLPIKIKCLHEGTLCPIRVPILTIINTSPKFFWITNFLETIISNSIWQPMTSATIAKIYKDELKRHAKKTGFSDDINIDFLCHDFSMRGMSGLESSILSGVGHLVSFVGSENLPVIEAIKEYYPSNNNELIASTVPATEHSVMCAGGVEDEFETFKRLITEVYPSGFVSIVSDTWDFWKVMADYLPRLKDIILNRDGRVVIRPDSGDPADIICGRDLTKKERVEYGGKGIQCEHKGAYEILWDIFGGTINEKGFKVLNPKVGIIYGDSITIDRQKEIYKRLEEKGFAATNLVLGIGSYTYQYKTRDSLGFAMKATWCQINNESKEIFKDPKTDDGVKKSLKGLCKVYIDEYNNIVVKDRCSKSEEDEGLLTTIFENGKLLKEVSLNEIRLRLNKKNII